MGFDGILYASRALTANQAALDITGENLARMNEAGYTRQRLQPQVGPATPLPLTPTIGVGPGGPLFPGNGVERFRDVLLDRTIRAQANVLAGAQTSATIFRQADAIFNESVKAGINKASTALIDAVQQAAVNPNDIPSRTLVLDRANTLAATFADYANQVQNLRLEAGTRATNAVTEANGILARLADMNAEIPDRASAETNRLLDQRDLLLDRLSEIIDIEVAVQPQGDIVVYQSAVPLVFGKTARSLSLTQDLTGAGVITTDTGKTLSNPGAAVGALLDAKNVGLKGFADQLDTLANATMTEVNRRLANSYDLNGNAGAALFSGTSAITMQVALNDPRQLGFATASLQSTESMAATGFTVDASQPLSTQNANLGNPLTAASGTIVVNGTAINWNDTQSINQILANFPPGVMATFDAARQRIVLRRDPAQGNSGPDLTVSETSGDLLNAFRLTTATLNKGVPGDAGGARSIVALNTTPVLGVPPSQSINQGIQALVQSVALTASRNSNAAETAQRLQDALLTEREQVSGVNSDEEAVHLVQYQRAYEAALRLANAQDEILDTLINRLGVR
ncbi:MAG: flagellar hook-associated protein FlgK [Armatimonadetes bacterium]|nr:flagellar hook-associated protein FlgK [Armatimonadota bacterium]